VSISIAWVTPYGKRSDVGAFSRNILIELAAAVGKLGGSVTIFVNVNGPTYWTNLPVVQLSGNEQDRELLSSFDFVFFNIGNNSANHRYINWLAVSVPGIAVVHDMVMQHFLAEEIFEKFQAKDFYARLVGKYYGDAGLDTVGRSQICSEEFHPVYAPWDTPHVASMPLLEPFIECAAAVVVHSAYAEQYVASRHAGPILRLALPWDQKPSLSAQNLEEWRAATIDRAICHVVCFGYIGRAKCLDLVIAAFAESALLRDKARLTIAGYPGDRDYAEELSRMVEAGGLGQLVEFEYSVSDERLLKLKQQADLFVNLRFPNTESASGSMVEQMNAGKPVLVFPSGCYAEIDRDAAVFVRREDGVHGVVDALEAMVVDPRQRISIGENGRRYGRRIGRSEYVGRLLAFLGENANLLRDRKKLRIGQRDAAIPLQLNDVDGPWMKELIDTRRLLTALHRPKYELAVSPFQTWDRHALSAFVTIGLFGRCADSIFERECRFLLARHQRPEFYRIIGATRIIWLCCQEPDSAFRAELFRLAAAYPTLLPDAFVLLRALGDEVFSRALYVGILGRCPSDEELKSCIEGFSLQPVELIVRGFLLSDEFKRRGAAPRAIEAFLAWCDQDHFCAFERQALECEITVWFSSDSPESRGYLGCGWHQPETTHVWSRNAISTLVFTVIEDAASDDLTVAITCRVTGIDLTGPRRLSTACNGSADNVIKITDDEWVNFNLELRRLPSGSEDFVVVFDAGTTINLAAAGNDQETRSLGLCLRSICLHRKSAG